LRQSDDGRHGLVSLRDIAAIPDFVLRKDNDSEASRYPDTPV
jgi:hypothetical protein